MPNISFNKLCQWSLMHVVLLSILVSVVPASATEVVGFIQKLDCQCDNCKKNILRKAKKSSRYTPIYLATPLHKGDTIKTRKRYPAKCFVTLVLGGEEKTVVLKPNGQNTYTVGGGKQNNSYYSMLTRTSQQINQWLGKLFVFDNHSNISSNVKGQGEFFQPLNLKIGLLPANTEGKIKKGKGPLYFAWLGGKFPFTVTINGKKQKVPDNQRQIILERSNYQIGKSYLVEIIDANKENFKRKFKVVSEKPTPTGFLPTHLQAAWLAYQSEAWKLEAYQYVANDTLDFKNSDAIKFVKMGLLTGIPLKK